MKGKLGVPPQFLIVLINFIVDLVETLLILRLVLILFGASTVTPFVTWIYETTTPLIYPFVGMFPSPKLTNGLVIEFSSLFGIVFYIFVGIITTEILETIIYFARYRKNKTTQ